MGGSPGGFMPMGSPVEDSRVADTILDNSYIIDELMHTLRGEVIDNTTNQMIKIGKPLMAEETIAWFIGRFNIYTSKVFSLSVLDEKTVKQIIYEFETEISLELMFPEQLGIDRKNRDYIKWLLVHSFTATIYKAFGGETLKKLLETHSVSEIRQKMDREKKSLLSGLSGLSGKNEGGFKL